MADNRTMSELLQAPTEGYEDAIIILEITANNFELQHGLINLVQNKKFFGHDKEDLHAHIHYFNKITSTMRVPNDSLNSAAGENFLDKMPRECLKIIESKSKVCQSRAKAVVAKVSTSSSTPAISSEVAELKDLVRVLLLDKKNQSSAPAPSPTPAPVKAVEPNCVTCGGSGTLPSNTVTNPKEELKGITTQSGVAYQGPIIPTPSKQGTKVTKDQVRTPSSQSTAPVQPLVIQTDTQTPDSEPVVAPVSAPMPNVNSSIPYPSRRDNERRRMDECLALADLGASINLMPLSVWEALLLSELTSNCMTLELADRSVSKPIGIANDVSFKKVLGFSDVTRSGNPIPYNGPIVSITSLTLTLFGDSDFLLFEEGDAFLGLEDDPNSPKINPFYYDPKGDILLLEAILNSETLPPLPNHEKYLPSFKKELKVCEAKTVKSFVDEPPEVELKDLPPHLEYTFLEGDNKLPVIFAKELGDEEKSALIKILMEEDYKPTVQHQRRVNPKIHDVIKKEVEKLLDAGLIYPISDSPWVSPTMELFMDDFSVFGNSFENCLSRLDKMLQRCEDTNLSLNWEKSYFMVKEGIVLSHKISKNGTEVDRAKVDVIAKLPHPTTVKGAVLGQRHEKHFKPIHYASKTMNDAESNYTTTEKEMLAVVYAFEKFRSYLIMNKSIVHTDHSALKYLFAKKMPRQDFSDGFYYSKNLLSNFLTQKEQRT
nr:DNA-directed DNA polymerase [Tanacetum cinerariifolium]